MNTIIVDNLMAWVRNEEDCAGNWRDDLPVIAVSELEQFIKEQPQPTKTATVLSSKSYLHSRKERELEVTEKALNDDKVNKPNHYVGVKGLEVEEVLQNFLPKYKDPYTSHRIGSAIEYQLRSPEKNGLEDLRKARKNLDQAISYEEGKIKDFDNNPFVLRTD